jgi:hypothetical protein
MDGLFQTMTGPFENYLTVNLRHQLDYTQITGKTLFVDISARVCLEEMHLNPWTE